MSTQFRSSIYSGCDKRPVEDETKYAVHVGRGRWLDMPCAPGTAFNPVDCRCSLTLMNIPGKVRQQGTYPLKVTFTTAAGGQNLRHHS